MNFKSLRGCHGRIAWVPRCVLLLVMMVLPALGDDDGGSIDEQRLEVEQLRDRLAAESLIARGEAMREQWPTEPSGSMAWSLNDAGLFMAAQGNDDGAVLLFAEALVLLDEHVAVSHPARGVVMQNLAEAQARLGDEESLAMFQAAAVNFGTSAGTDHPRLAALLNAWAGANLRFGNQEEAIALYRRAISIYETHSKRDLDVVAPLHNLAVVYMDQGEWRKASMLLAAAWGHLTRARARQTPQALMILQAQTQCALRLEEMSQAAEFDRKAQALRMQLAESLP